MWDKQDIQAWIWHAYWTLVRNDYTPHMDTHIRIHSHSTNLDDICAYLWVAWYMRHSCFLKPNPKPFFSNHNTYNHPSVLHIYLMEHTLQPGIFYRKQSQLTQYIQLTHLLQGYTHLIMSLWSRTSPCTDCVLKWKMCYLFWVVCTFLSFRSKLQCIWTHTRRHSTCPDPAATMAIVAPCKSTQDISDMLDTDTAHRMTQMAHDEISNWYKSHSSVQYRVMYNPQSKIKIQIDINNII